MSLLSRVFGRFSIRKKILLTVSLLWLLGSTLLVTLAYFQAKNDLEEGIRTRARETVALGALSVPVEAHARLLGSADQDSADYAAVFKVLQAIQKNNADIRYLYTVRKNQAGKIVFVTDATDPTDNPSLIGDPVETATALLKQSVEGLGAAVVEKDFYTDQWGTFWTAYAPLVSADGKFEGLLCADIEASTVQTILRNHLNDLIGLIFVSLLLLIPVWLVVTRSVVQPLRECVVATDLLAKSDYTRPLRPGLVRRDDEIGDLARSFSTLMDNTRQLIRSIHSQAEILAGVGDDLNGQMQSAAVSARAIAGNMGLIQQNSHQQFAGVTKAGATVQQISLSIQQAAGLIERQAGCVATSSAAIEQMLASLTTAANNLERNAGNVRSLSSSSERGKSDMGQVSARIRHLAKESEGLLAVSEVIKDIAAQTNLLSMNAAIEAAHAGASGRGFAVVADEIRKLAQSSATQAATVTASLKSLQRSMEEAAKSSDEVLRQFEDIDSQVGMVAVQEQQIRQSLTELDQGSNEILQSLAVLKEVTAEVRSGSEQMFVESREVIQESAGLATLAREVVDKVDRVSDETTQVAEVVQKVQVLSATNKGCIGELVQEALRFRVEA
ncbi:MAG: HAMP domain-containing methyl-accepting chemotaxis protein [Spirochaetales bacterium]